MIYRTVQKSWLSFQGLIESEDRKLPFHVAREIDAFLRCGIHAHGSLRLQYLDDIFKNSINTVYSNPVNIERAVKEADLVIGTVMSAGAKAPKSVTREMIRQTEPNSVVVGFSIDQGGCIETIKPTLHSDPIFRYENVIHYCVTNMPGAVAQTSTYTLTNRTMKYALLLADNVFHKALY